MLLAAQTFNKYNTATKKRPEKMWFVFVFGWPQIKHKQKKA